MLLIKNLNNCKNINVIISLGAHYACILWFKNSQICTKYVLKLYSKMFYCQVWKLFPLTELPKTLNVVPAHLSVMSILKRCCACPT